MEKDIHGAMSGGKHPSPAETGPDARPGAPSDSSKKSPNTTAYKVIVGLPELLPVTEGELELLESELADFIAEFLKT